MAVKDLKYVKVHSVNPLYLIFKKVNGYFKEINGKKYLTLVPANESKEKVHIKINLIHNIFKCLYIISAIFRYN